MKILGADGLTVGINAMNAIPPSYLSNGDACLAKYEDLFYFYELDSTAGGSENLPSKVVPLDEGVPTVDDKRWILKSIYLPSINTTDIFANSLSQATSGVPLIINNTISLSGDMATFTNEHPLPPFAVESTYMVTNLNAEYLGGIHWSEWGIDNWIQKGIFSIPIGSDTFTVGFAEERFNVEYALFTEIQYNDVAEPSIIQHIVSDKTTVGFTVRLSSAADISDYWLQYTILGDNIDYEEYDLIDVYGFGVQDVNGNQITVF